MQDQNVKLGELYSDEVTSFAGVATGCSVFLTEPSQICLENDHDSRWFVVNRITPATQETKKSPEGQQLAESAQTISSKTVSISSS